MSKLHHNPEEIKHQHPRFAELKVYHKIEDERSSMGVSGPQKMGTGLLSITFRCVGASIGEKPPLTKKLPTTTTVGKLKNLCESFFKLKGIKQKMYFHEEVRKLTECRIFGRLLLECLLLLLLNLHSE